MPYRNPQDVFEAPGRFYKGNIHTHSTNSDGRLEPAAVCAQYREAGYDFLCLSDHFLARYDFPISDTRPYRTRNFTTLIGAEVHAPATTLGDLWHILAVGLPGDFPATAEDETGPALAARCAAAGAFVGIAHPQWYGLTLEDAMTVLDSAHAVEVYNHTCAVNRDRPDGFTLLDELSSRGYRLGAYAVDDAHFHASDAFGGWVMVKAEANEPEALLAGLKAGNYYASQGPALHGIHRDGEMLVVECSPAASILAVGQGSAGDMRHGAALTRASFELERFRAGGWLRVVVVDRAGRRGWSGPIWL